MRKIDSDGTLHWGSEEMLNALNSTSYHPETPQNQVFHFPSRFLFHLSTPQKQGPIPPLKTMVISPETYHI